jgi:signal transduction histidine kinase
MDGYQHEISLIKKILKENPKGMTVTDISRKIKINRNSVAKYLDIMRISGHVEMITFGPAKVFFPSRRVPISDMLNYTSDYILVFDINLKITIVNNSFLHFINLNREEVIGNRIDNVIEKIFKNNTEILNGIKEALKGKNFNKDINFQENKNNYFFKVKVIPTTFEDGKYGGTLVIINKTDHKIVEKILRESEENFRDLLNKINKG